MPAALLRTQEDANAREVGYTEVALSAPVRCEKKDCKGLDSCDLNAYEYKAPTVI